MTYELPASYDPDDNRIVALPQAIIPIVAGRLHTLEYESSWESNQAAGVQAALLVQERLITPYTDASGYDLPAEYDPQDYRYVAIPKALIPIVHQRLTDLISPAAWIAEDAAAGPEAIALLQDYFLSPSELSPPDYDDTNDHIWRAGPGYVYEDIAGTIPLSGEGMARGWRSTKMQLAKSNQPVFWDGVDTFMHTGAEGWMTNVLSPVYPQPNTICIVGHASSGIFGYIFDGLGGHRHAIMSTYLYAGKQPAILYPGNRKITITVFNGAASVFRVGINEQTLDVGGSSLQGFVFAQRLTGGNYLTGSLSEIWIALGRAFDLATRNRSTAWYDWKYGL